MTTAEPPRPLFADMTGRAGNGRMPKGTPTGIDGDLSIKQLKDWLDAREDELARKDRVIRKLIGVVMRQKRRIGEMRRELREARQCQ